MGYILIYLSARAHCFNSIEHDFSIEFSLNLHLAISEMRTWILAFLFPPYYLDLHLGFAWWVCFSLGDVCFTSFSIKVSFLMPAKVSRQYIPKGIHKEIRVIVAIGSKGFLLC
jgi:hypothetical protein